MEPQGGTQPVPSSTADNPPEQPSNAQAGGMTIENLQGALGVRNEGNVDTSTPAAARGQITLEQMRQALGGRRTVDNAALLAAQRELMMTTPTVDDLLSVDRLRSALDDPRMQEAMTSLYQHLPEQDRSVAGLEQVLRSPPLRSQAATLSHALRQSAQPNELLRSFEFPSTSEGYGPKALLDALLKLQKQSEGQGE